MNKKINIGYVNDVPFYLGYGGKEVQLLAYENYIKENSIKINVRKLNVWNKSEFDDIDIVHIFGSTKGVHTLISLIKSNNKNIKIILSPNFYISSPKFMKVLELFSKFCPIPNVLKYRREIFMNADKILVNSLSEKKQLIYLYPKLSNNNINVILNGIDEQFNILDNTDCFIEKYNLEKGYLLSVAFLDERKNYIKLVEAFLLSKNLHSKKLVLIGGFRFNTNANKEKMTKLIEQNEDRIIHIPYIDKNTEMEILQSAYYNCSAHLLPSILETPGISSIEAISFGKPILVGECEPVYEYFGDDAIYVNQYSVDDISKKIVEISNLDVYIPKSSYKWSEQLKSLESIYIGSN